VLQRFRSTEVHSKAIPSSEKKLGRYSVPPQSSYSDGAHGLSTIGGEANTIVANMEPMGGNSQLFLQGLD
jgi:hypothetical protein